MSIISLLLGISLPALNKARHQARSLLGQSNQRQIVRAVNLFAMDNDDQYPESVATLGPESTWNWGEPTTLTSRESGPHRYRSMSAYLWAYIPDARTLHCPQAPQRYKYLQAAWEAGEAWTNPDAPDIGASVNGTYCFYWNYTGLLQEQGQFFNGPRSLSGGFRQSKLLVSCYFGYDHWQNPNVYRSCNKFKNADSTKETRYASSFWSGLDSDHGLDTINIKLHAGYTDEHVESYGPAEVIPMEVIMNRSTVEPYLSGPGPGGFYLPRNGLH